MQPADHFHRLGQRRQRQQDAELLAAVASGHVDVAQIGAQQIREPADHGIALRVAVQIVDLLEVIQIRQHQRGGLAGAAAAGEFRAHGVFPVAAVEQPGQPVVPAAQFQFVAAVVQAAGDVVADVQQGQRRQQRQRQAGQERESVQPRQPVQAVDGNAHQHAQREGQQIAREQARAAAEHGGKAGHREQRRADRQVERDQRQRHPGEHAINQDVLHLRAVGMAAAAIAPARQVRPAQADQQGADPVSGRDLQRPHRRHHRRQRQRAGDDMQQVQPMRIDEVRCERIRRRQPLHRRRARDGAHGACAASSPDAGIVT